MTGGLINFLARAYGWRWPRCELNELAHIDAGSGSPVTYMEIEQSINPSIGEKHCWPPAAFSISVEIYRLSSMIFVYRRDRPSFLFSVKHSIEHQSTLPWYIAVHSQPHLWTY